MKRPTTLTGWDFADTEWVRDGWDEKQVPKATAENFNKLLDNYNNLVKVVNELAEKNALKFEDDE